MMMPRFRCWVTRSAHSAALALALFCLTPAPGQAEDFELVCHGEGVHRETDTAYVNSYNRRRHSFESGTVMETHDVPYHGTAYVEVSGDFVRIKAPSQMLPLIRSTHDGWLDVRDVFINDREITGRLRINGLNKKDLRIDRRTGDMSVGDDDFFGRCESVDDRHRRRAF